jgi:hypothetical protein
VTEPAVRHEARPELYGPLLARFALNRRERLVGRALVALARVPGAVRLLLRWHDRRAKK